MYLPGTSNVLLKAFDSEDLMVKYHQNAALVQELITGKLVSGDWKDHPEFPGREATGLMNYGKPCLCFVH